jgi:1H-pyrrole-2-carbonyl-[peptidyl-carrier protein] chlorinase
MEQPVVIIGGGPGGSALGCYLSKAGIKNVIFEREVHPRPHVGESMVPSTTRVFQDLGFLEVLERERCVRKYGASWHPANGKASLCIEFKEFPQEDITQDYTYHVDRAKFDMLLFKHAESLGSTVYQGVRVKKVLFEGDKAAGVQVEIAGKTVDVPARMVVDASGRHTFLGTQLGLKEKDSNFNQFAVHAWFENVDRGVRPDDIHIHFLPVKRGWVWQIPITDEITSIGVVAERAVFRQGKGDYGAWFGDLIKSAPDIEQAMSGARQVNEFKVEADYSYAMKSFVGNNWLLIGDAARFVDPIFSSGVSVAMYSAKFASERIQQAIELNDFRKAVFEPYEARLRGGTSIWYEFILMYYKLLPIFTHFIAKKDYRLQVLQLLQGEVYDRKEAPVLDAMRQFIGKVEDTDGHLLSVALDKELSVEAL